MCLVFPEIPLVCQEVFISSAFSVLYMLPPLLKCKSFHKYDETEENWEFEIIKKKKKKEA